MSLDQAELATGSYLKFILGEPAAPYGVAQYEAMTWPSDSEVIDVVSVGEGGGSAADVSYTPLKSGEVITLPGAITYNARAIQMGRHLQTDATHQLIKSCFNGANKGKKGSLAIHYPDGTIQYQTGSISSFNDGSLEAGSFMMTTFNFTPNRKDEIKPGSGVFTLTYSAGANGAVYGELSQIVEDGEDGSAVFAAPLNPATHEFSAWSDASTDNPRTDTNVTANITVTATFTTV